MENNIGEFSSKQVFTRNQVLNDDVSLVENNDSTSTDILHEYFIPKRNFNLFIDGIKQILPNEKIDLLNITLRNVYPDNDSFLSYVKEEVFALDVAEAFLNLAKAKKTTGNIMTVDGGNMSAILR